MIKIQEARNTKQDIENTFKLSNDPIVRKSSFNSKEIEYSEHKNWYSKILNNKDKLFLLFYDNENFVGQIRFNKMKLTTDAEISISIAENYREKKLGSTLLTMALSKLKDQWPSIKNIIAEVKIENIASNKFFINNEFVKLEQSTHENLPCNIYKKSIKKSDKKPFIIAEMSGNHNKSLERALEIVEEAAKSGCSALKIQTYTADSITIDCDSPDFVINDNNSLWNGEKLYNLYQKASTPYEWHKPIFDKCKELNITCFSTPFDSAAVDFLETLDCPIYKIASFENGDIPLLKKVAQTKKPVIISLGMIELNEIQEAVDTLINNGCTDLTLLKCTSTYPADPKNTNLFTIPDLIKRFPNCQIGLSDHTIGIGVSIAAIALGATVIEKHFTLDRSDGGVDSAFSIEPSEMKQLVEECNNAFKALGKVTYELTDTEKESLKFRRSIYAVKNIKEGEIFTTENIRCIRPGFGLHPREYDKLIGSKAPNSFIYGEKIK